MCYLMERKKHLNADKKVKELEKKLSDQQKQTREFKETAQRVQAEFENFSKRIEKQKEEFKSYARAELIVELLTVMDSFNEAISSIEKQKEVSKEEYLHGIKLLKKQIAGVLEKNGLKEIKAEGKKFDPHFHECLTQAHDKTKEDEVVLEEIQKGYLLNDKVLRTTKVKINKLEEKK